MKDAASMPADAADGRLSRRHTRRRWLFLFIATWTVAAYVVVQRLWEAYFRGHPDYAQALHVTRTADGNLGDPVNIALVGSQADVSNGMHAAGWFAADPLGLKSDVRIAVDSVLRRPDDEAPVSDLFLFDRKEDLAFEQQVGNSRPRSDRETGFAHCVSTKSEAG